MSCCIPTCPPPCPPPCLPTCTVPSCASAPTIGLGSCGYGYGGMGSGMLGYGSGSAVSASNLGIVPGAAVGCITQTPASEVVIQPPAVVVTVPGPILSATCEPVAVGGYSPCAPGSGGYLGGGYGYGGLGGLGGLGGICRPRRKASICKYPC